MLSGGVGRKARKAVRTRASEESQELWLIANPKALPTVNGNGAMS